MFKKILTTTALASLMAFSASSFAATTPVNKNGTFVGVNGIDIDGVSYNVSWSLSRDSLPLKLYDKTFAQKASSHLYQTLNSHIADHLWTFDKHGFFRFANQNAHIATLNTYWMESSPTMGAVGPNSATMSQILLFDRYFSGYPELSLDSQHTYGTIDRNNSYHYEVTWTKVSAVPTPSAALMFAPALLGFAALRRKKRA